MPQQNDHSDQLVLKEQDEVQHILGHPPGWILRWGISIIFVLVGIFIFLSWLIRYPDIIPATVVIVGEEPAIRVVAQADGKLSRLFVADMEKVDSGAVLAVIDNAASWKDIQTLKTVMEKAEGLKTEADWQMFRPSNQLDIGPLQYSYASFLQHLRDFQFFIQKNDVQATLGALEQQLSQLDALNKNLESQKSKLKKETDLAGRNLDRNTKLQKEGLISDQELEASEAIVLDYRRRLENLASQQLDNQIRMEQIRTRIIEIGQGRVDGKSEREGMLKNDVQRILGELQDWEQRYLLVAPIAGQLSMTRIWSAQQFVKTNEEVFVIVPENGSSRMLGKAFLPVSNSGKVRSGMKVNIRLEGYPYQEFGVVKARVRSSSLVPEENTYLLEIELPDSLITTYNHLIPFRQEMQGVAQIITEDRRILSRVFDKVLSILKNN